MPKTKNKEDAADEGEKTVRLTVNLTPALHKAARLKALEEGVKVGPKVRELLELWIADQCRD